VQALFTLRRAADESAQALPAGRFASGVVPVRRIEVTLDALFT